MVNRFVNKRVVSKLVSWAADNGAGPLVSWATLGYPAPPATKQYRPLRQLDAYVATHGLDEARRVGIGEQQMCIVLTADEVLLGRRGGLSGNNPKELLARCPLAEVTIEWFDTPHMVADQRNLVMHFGDTWAATAAMVNKNMNTEAFIDALGPRAVMVVP